MRLTPFERAEAFIWQKAQIICPGICGIYCVQRRKTKDERRKQHHGHPALCPQRMGVGGYSSGFWDVARALPTSLGVTYVLAWLSLLAGEKPAGTLRNALKRVELLERA